MAQVNSYTCDHCGVARGAANHWFLLVVTRDAIHVLPWRSLNAVIADGARHVCGERCLQIEISSAIANGRGGSFGVRPRAEQVILQEVIG